MTQPGSRDGHIGRTTAKELSERRDILKPHPVLQRIDVYTDSSHREHIKVTPAAGYHDDSTSSRMSNASDTTNQETYVNTIDNVASHPTPNTEIAARLYPDAARTIGPPLALPTNRLCVSTYPQMRNDSGERALHR